MGAKMRGIDVLRGLLFCKMGLKGESAPKKWGWGLPFCRKVALQDFEGILIL